MALEVPSWFSKTNSDFGAMGSSVTRAGNDVGNSKADNYEDFRNDVVFSVSSAENGFENSKTEEFYKSMNNVCTERISFEISSWLFGNNMNSGDLDKTRNDFVGEEKQASVELDSVGSADDFCPFRDSDFEALQAEIFVEDNADSDFEALQAEIFVEDNADSDFEALQAEIFVEDNADPFFRGNWKEGEDFMVYFLGTNSDMEIVSMLLEVCNFLDMLNVDPDALEDVIKQETQCFLDMHEKVRKGNVYLMNATFVKLQLIAGLKYYRHFKSMCRIEHETVLSNPNLCYENHELANLIGFLYDKEPEPACLNYEGSFSASWKDCKYLAGFQGPKMLETDGGLSIFLERSSAWQSKDGCIKPGNSLSREMKRSKDPWEECSASMLYDTGHIITHAVSENPSTSTAHCGEPSEAIFFALAYLGLSDLLAVERVCKSLRDKVRNDPLLWRHIHVDSPLSKGLTDDALLQLAKRSQGLLQHLSLVQCLQITHDGLKRVLTISPKLTELSLLYCPNFTGEGIVNIVEAHKEFSLPGLKLLKINGTCNVTRDHVEKLKSLMDGGSQRSQVVKQHFYPCDQHYSVTYDDCLIDIEECPRCGKARLVYDCTLESCQGKGCRGCIFCISRCRKCGRCIDELRDEYEETMPYYDLLCADCSLCCQLRKAVEPWLLHP